MRRQRILLGDDHALVLNGITAVLQPHHDVVGSAPDGRRLVDLAAQLNPDIVILDVSMPLLNGLEAARQINANSPSTKLIVLSGHANPMYLRRALDYGATGYVLKSGVVEELLVALGEVLKGEIYVSPGFGKEVLEERWNRSGKPARQEEGLTIRQREILQLVAEGRPSKEIAHILGISVKTVDFHRGGIMTRLGVRSIAELTRVAIELGLISTSATDTP